MTFQEYLKEVFEENCDTACSYGMSPTAADELAFGFSSELMYNAILNAHLCTGPKVDKFINQLLAIGKS